MCGDTRKFADDQELASFNFEKRDLASSAATIGGSKRGGSAWSISEEAAETKAAVITTTPSAKRDRRSSSESACADDLDEAASTASSVVEKDVDMKYLTGTSKEILSAIIKRLDITTICGARVWAAPTTAQRRT